MDRVRFVVGVPAGALRPLCERVPPLSASVTVVGQHVAEEEVVRADARRIVAAVEHPKPAWDGAVVQFPGVAVRSDIDGPSGLPKSEASVAIAVNIAGPDL